MNMRHSFLAFGTVVALCSLLVQTPTAQAIESVYTMSNAVAGNEVLVFTRGPLGHLHATGTFATGGNGTGGGLGNQGAVVLDPSDRWLFVVNAGSGSISSLQVLNTGLQLVDTKPSGGSQPISLTVFGTLLYVLNAGDASNPSSADNITGFRIHADGTLSAIPGATQPLSARLTGPAQISFNITGTVLLVTEKATNLLTTYTVDADGLPGAPLSRASAVPTPFGFAFGDRDQVFVSEANGGGSGVVTSYHVDRDTGVVSNAINVLQAQNAPCWVALGKDQTVGYVTNTGSASISLFQITFDGTMAPLLRGRHAITTGKGPIDLVITQNGRFLYTLDATDDTISAFYVLADGQLVRVGRIHVPDGANGLAAR